MELVTHTFLREHRNEIVREWEALASSGGCDVPLAGSAVRDNLPELLDELARWLEREDPERTASLCACASHHALQRLDHSFQLPQLLREYALLRAAILRLLLREESQERAPPGAPAEERAIDLARLNAGLDLAVSGAVSHFIDQRDRRAADLRRSQGEALQASEQRLRAHIDNSPIAVIEFDPHFAVTRWSKEAERIFGWTAEETIGRRFTELRWVHEDDEERVHQESARLLRGDWTRTLTAVRNYRKDGSIIHCEWYGSALHDAQGGLVSILAHVLDVTARKRAEAELRESEERFRTLADNIAQLAWMADEKGSLFWFNERWFDYTGTTLGEVRGRGWRKVHHPDHVERVVEKLERCFEAGEPWEDAFPLRGRDGAYRWFLCRAFPIRDERGRVARWFGTATDVSDQREAQEALRTADQRKTEFLAVLSHELRNCLAPMQTGLHLLERSPPGTPLSDRAREIIRRQVDHAAGLVDDLLDISRIETGKIKMERARFDARDVVRRACEDVRATFEERGVALRLDLAAVPLWVDADEARLTQIVGNLLGNALKFSSPPGCVDVTLRDESGMVELRVRDTGAGIEARFLDKIFEPFTQVERTKATAHGGMGIGLALVKSLVTMQGGTVRARSEGKGTGAEFIVSLPLVAAPAVRAPRPKPSPAAIPSLEILIVDDNRDAAETLGQLLQLEGHRIRLAFDGESATEAFRELAPDVFVSDVGLPDVSGYDLMRTIRRLETGRPVFAVALTGYAQADDVERAREAGFDAHLPKPAPLQRLDEMLADAAARREEPKPPPRGADPGGDEVPAENDGADARPDPQAPQLPAGARGADPRG